MNGFLAVASPRPRAQDGEADDLEGRGSITGARFRMSRFGWLLLVLVLAGLGHRALLFFRYFADLQSLIAANPDWVTWQYLPPKTLARDLPAALLYLQQSPPIPNVILGVVTRCLGWPYGAAYALIWFQAALSITAAGLLFRLLYEISERWLWAGFAAAALFLLSTDLVVMEYNSFGQTFYENLPMVLVLVMMLASWRLHRRGRAASSWTIGLCAAALALTRAAYALVAAPTLFAVLLLAPSRRWAHAGRALAVVALLHGGWTVKNFLVFHQASPNTSSWGGGNFAVGFIRAGYGDEFLAFLKSEPDRHPEWFNRLMNEKGLALWHPPVFTDYVPADVRSQDERIQSVLHGENPAANSSGQRELFEQYLAAYGRFARANPGLILRKFRQSYLMFWQPIRNYGIQYVSLFATRVAIIDVLNVRSTVSSLRHRALPEQQLLMRGTFPKQEYSPAQLFTPDLPAPFILTANFLGVHALAPLLVLAGLATWRRQDAARRQRLLFLTGLLAWYAYAAVVFNLAEFGENVRFRVSVEPLIWVISALAFAELLRLAASVWGRKRGGTAPVGPRPPLGDPLETLPLLCAVGDACDDVLA